MLEISSFCRANCLIESAYIEFNLGTLRSPSGLASFWLICIFWIVGKKTIEQSCFLFQIQMLVPASTQRVQFQEIKVNATKTVVIFREQDAVGVHLFIFFKTVITCISLRYRWSCVHVHWRACIAVQVFTLLWINAGYYSVPSTNHNLRRIF